MAGDDYPIRPPNPAFGARLRARGRAAVLIPIVMDVPALRPAVEALTREPEVENLEIDGVSVEVARPPGDGAWPAFVFVTGAHPLRRKEPVVQRLAHGLARAGYVALVPDLPGLGEGELTSRTIDAAEAVIEAAAARPDVRGGRVALVGASAGASIALLAGSRPKLAQRISLVAAVSPFADLQKVVCLATTTFYEESGGFVEYTVTTLLRRAVGRSMVAALPTGDDREELLRRLGVIEDEDHDPFEQLRAESRFGPEAGAIVKLLTNRDPARFAELYAALPEDVRRTFNRLSPLAAAAEVVAPVELVVPPSDPYFPSGEAQALASSLPNVRLTVTPTLDHTRPMASLRRIGGLRSFESFVVRGLAAAAAG